MSCAMSQSQEHPCLCRGGCIVAHCMLAMCVSCACDWRGLQMTEMLQDTNLLLLSCNDKDRSVQIDDCSRKLPSTCDVLQW